MEPGENPACATQVQRSQRLWTEGSAQESRLDEAERIINENGRAPHDEHIVLNDGRVLRTADEVREWVRSMAVAAADGDAV